jgi:hypothetical protein
MAVSRFSRYCLLTINRKMLSCTFVDMADRFALVEVPEALADTVIDALRATTIKGRRPHVRRERPR